MEKISASFGRPLTEAEFLSRDKSKIITVPEAPPETLKDRMKAKLRQKAQERQKQAHLRTLKETKDKNGTS